MKIHIDISKERTYLHALAGHAEEVAGHLFLEHAQHLCTANIEITLRSGQFFYFLFLKHTKKWTTYSE